MDLVQNVTPAEVRYEAHGTFTIEPGKSLILETTPDGVEMINEEVPAGKVWRTIISVSVIETDA